QGRHLVRSELAKLEQIGKVVPQPPVLLDELRDVAIGDGQNQVCRSQLFVASTNLDAGDTPPTGMARVGFDVDVLQRGLELQLEARRTILPPVRLEFLAEGRPELRIAVA